MKFTQEEIDLTSLVAARCKEYGFFVSPNRVMFIDRENPQVVHKNQIICMLRRDLRPKTTLQNKRFNQLLDASVKALLIMCEQQINKNLVTLSKG